MELSKITLQRGQEIESKITDYAFGGRGIGKIETENAKVSIRTIRKEANEELKKLQKNGQPEDEVKEGEAKVQLITDGYVVKCDKHLEVKEKEIMTV